MQKKHITVSTICTLAFSENNKSCKYLLLLLEKVEVLLLNLNAFFKEFIEKTFMYIQ